MDIKKDLDLASNDNSKDKAENPEQRINDWNDRLDENLEPKAHNDISADEKAEDFSKKYGSGDQSDQG